MLAKKVQEEFKKEAKKVQTELKTKGKNDDLKIITEISEEEAKRRLIKQMLENINNQTEEYEEFLDEEEIKQMTNEGMFDSYEETYHNNRQIRR